MGGVHQERLTGAECLNHPYFEGVEDPNPLRMSLPLPIQTAAQTARVGTPTDKRTSKKATRHTVEARRDDVRLSPRLSVIIKYSTRPLIFGFKGGSRDNATRHAVVSRRGAPTMWYSEMTALFD